MDKKFIFFVMFCLFSFNAKAVTTLDVLIVYTSEMNTSYSGNPNVRISQMVSWANVALQNSVTDVQFKLVGAEMLNVPHSVEVSQSLLDELIYNGALMDLRNKYKPALTLYLTKSSSSLCGIAWMPKSSGAPRSVYPNLSKSAPLFAVGAVGYDCENYVLAHEAGHVLGAGHGVRDSGNGNGFPITSSRGYGVDNLFSDVMAYSWLYGNATRLQYFSSPNIKSCFGMACGTSNDNAASGIKTFSLEVAKYPLCYPVVALRGYGCNSRY